MRAYTSRSSSAPGRCRLTLETLEDRLLLASDVVLDWNEVLLNAIRNDTHHAGPTWASRSTAIVQGAIYDTVNAFDRTHTPFIFGLPQAPRNASMEAAVAKAAQWTLRSLFPQQREIFNAALQTTLATVPDGRAEQKGLQFGKAIARAYLDLRSEDGARNGNYNPGNGPGAWRPTPPDNRPALGPRWGEVDPFVMDFGSQFRPPPPPPLNSAQYAAAFNEVKSLGALDSTTRTADQSEIAKFWAYDTGGFGTPVVLYNQLARTIAEDQDNTVVENARLLALVNFAIADACIAGWDAKYAYDFWRPITAIRKADVDGNPATERDRDWQPFSDVINGFTPPFPAYVSGHSIMGSATVEVLQNFYGRDNISFTMTSDELPGVTRSYDRLSHAEEENAVSRIYLGIHWRFDLEVGQTMGESIGDLVTENYLLPINYGAIRGRSFLAASETGTSQADQTLDPRLGAPATTDPAKLKQRGTSEESTSGRRADRTVALLLTEQTGTSRSTSSETQATDTLFSRATPSDWLKSDLGVSLGSL